MSFHHRIETLWGERAEIFLVALTTRIVAGWSFFGCVDMSNNLRFSQDLFAGRSVTLPYLPGVQYLIWLGGIIATRTNLPLTFAYKIFPIACDAMSAVLVYDACKRRGDRAWIGGLLYALCPIGVIVSAIHAQWDPIFLLLTLIAFELKDRESLAWRFCAGVAFFAAIVVKPVPLALLPLLFSLPRAGLGSVPYARGEVAKIAGFLATGAFYYVKAAAADYPIVPALPLIVSYGKEGWPLFGLPWELVHKNRLLLVFAVVPIFVAYAREKIDAYGATLAFFALAIGTSGLAPQYLLWVVPFAIVQRRYAFLVVYNALSVALMLIFYTNPMTSNVAFENSATFATLRVARWLMPPISTSSTTLARMRFIGDWALPLTSLALLTLMIVEVVIGWRRTASATKRADRAARRAPWAYAVFAAVMITGASLVAHSPVSVWEFDRARDAKLLRYVEMTKAPLFYTLGESTKHASRSLNAVSIGAAWGVAWSVAVCFLLASRMRARA